VEKTESTPTIDNIDLYQKYIKPALDYEGNPVGAAEVVGALARNLGAQSLGGWAGMRELLAGHGLDKATDAIQRTAAAGQQQELSDAGQRAVRSIAPIYRGAADSPLGAAAARLADKYSEGVNTDADLMGKYLGPAAGGLTQAAGAVAPMLAGPGEEKAALEPPGALPSYFEPLLEDGAHTGTLEREAAANARRAEDGIPVADVQPSEFAGRQAEHEGAVARRDKEPRQLSVFPGTQSHLAGAVPDDANVYTSSNPETGEMHGYAVTVPRGGAHQMTDIMVYPQFRRQGVGTDLFNKAVAGAHDAGLPFHSDTSVTPEQLANVHHSGHTVEFNPDTEEGEGPYGPALKSRNAQPVYTIPAPVEATDGEPEAGSWISRQAFADGGEAGTLLSGLGDLIKQYAPLKGMPTKATVPGVGVLDVGPHQPARDAATAYMKAAGLPYNPPSTYAKVDPARATQIAQAFDAMPHAPDDPAVKASYDAMIKETLAQYQHMKNTGLRVEFNKLGEDPYAASPRLAAEDVKNNNHLWVFPTEAGFGTGADAGGAAGNPLLGASGESFGGVPATNNDVFRAVHDYFGHIKEGVGFRANGEENAWRQHAGMYSDLARPAMTAETRGQNSWLNYGPHGETNRTAKTADTVFAPQKTGILPDEFNNLEDPEQHFLHMSNLSDPEVTLDPKFYGTGLKGREARRGGTPVTSLYPADIDPATIETGLQQKTPYRVSVPAKSMYDLSTDPEGHLSNMPDFSAVEDAIREGGYAGYHLPQAEGLFRGQGRLFGPTPATRLGPGPAAEEDLSQGFAEGGEVGTALGGLGELIAKYAPEAEHLAAAAPEGVTYNPTTGDLHGSGYIVPTQPHRTQVLQGPPSPDDVHDFMMQNQDAFDEDPAAVLHAHSDSNGNHFLHVAHLTPDFGAASDVAAQHGLPGFQDLASGEIHPANHGAATADVSTSTEAPAPDLVNQYLAGPARVSTPWTPGQQTVANPKRNAFPGIYNDPRKVIEDASAKVGPEDPLLQQLFGVSRSDLSDLSLSRQGNELGSLPGAKPNPTGAASARDVMTPANEQRLIDVLGEARKSPELYKGMTGWYAMDPLYERFVQLYGEDEAPSRYEKFNTLMGMASPGSDVGTEIARGTSAHWLDTQGRFEDFLKYGGGKEAATGRQAAGTPADMAEVPGHAYHRTAQGGPMADYLRTGSVQMQSPKVPPYIRASGVPQTGFQTDLPVGDAHWARAVGLADTRGSRTSRGQEIVPGSSVSTPEMQALHPWWKNRVAGPAGLESVPAQALLWGSMSPYTGVQSAIGAPKLEMLSTQIGKLAQRMGISPESARDLVIQGKAGAYRDGGLAGKYAAEDVVPVDAVD
jgi:hypothetical protein